MTASGAGDQPAELRVGDVVEVTVGAVAHGGHCVARYDGRVVFIRHALPGEHVLVRITEARPGSFCRGDAIEVLSADPERVPAPCVHFHPGGCGGCDFMHASAQRQRELKAAVVAEQLHRLAGVDRQVIVEALPGDGFGWRDRVRWALDEHGRIGPRTFRSHRVQGVNPVQPCLIAASGLTELAATIEVPAGIRERRAGGRPADRRRGGVDRRSGSRAPGLPEVVLVRTGAGETLAVWDGQSAPTVTEHAAGRDFSVAADGFWQAHPAVPDVLADAVAEAVTGLDLGGTACWDLYAGVGLFAAVLAQLPRVNVVTVESDPTASALAAHNLADLPQVAAVVGRVEVLVADLPGPVGAVVMDPPRSGAGAAVCSAIAERRPAVIVYVACDPAALGRDTAALAAAGYRFDTLRAFDAFPQTHHVECVARYLPEPRS